MTMSHNAEDLGLYTVNTLALYQRAKETMRSIAGMVRDGSYTENKERELWLAHADEGAAYYRREFRSGSFPLPDRQDAALYIAEHYRDELRYVCGVELPVLK